MAESSSTSEDTEFDQIPCYGVPNNRMIPGQKGAGATSAAAEAISVVVGPRMRGKARSWIMQQTFPDSKTALEFIKNEDIWSVSGRYDTKAGSVVCYECRVTKQWRRSKKRGAAAGGCPCSTYLLYHADRESVTMYRTEADHEHEPDDQSADRVGHHRGIPAEIQSIIVDLHDNHGVTTPNKINFELRARGLEEVDKRKLNNFLQAYRRKRKMQSEIQFAGDLMKELEAWCQAHGSNSNADHDDDHDDIPFVINREIDIDQNQYFRIFLSTPRLLQNAALSGDGDDLIIHADTRFKLLWHEFPVSILGVSDRDGRCFPIGLAVCNGETVDDYRFIFRSLSAQIGGLLQQPRILLITDAATNDCCLAKGFEEIFGGSGIDNRGDHGGDQGSCKIAVCWTNVCRNLDKALQDTFSSTTTSPPNKSNNNENNIVQRLRSDILQLRLCPDDGGREIFDTAVRLFFQKWSAGGGGGIGKSAAAEKAKIRQFLDYFYTEWVEKNNTWYAGYCSSISSNNNDGLESIYRKLKRDQLIRERLPTGQFLQAVQRVLIDWSKEITIDHHHQSITTKKITPIDWANAYRWARDSKPILSKKEGGGSGGESIVSSYFIPSSHANPQILSPNSVNSYVSAGTNLDWPTFDRYVQWRMSMWRVRVRGNDWDTKATCNCPEFLERIKCCKHVLGLPIRLGLRQVPIEAKSMMAMIDNDQQGGRKANIPKSWWSLQQRQLSPPPAEQTPKKKRGRPRKNQTDQDDDQDDQDDDYEEEYGGASFFGSTGRSATATTKKQKMTKKAVSGGQQYHQSYLGV